MIHATIAHEFRAWNGQWPHTKVLQYSPGPLKTDMTLAARAGGRPPSTADRWVEPSESAGRLMALLGCGDYASGEHVDFFDDRAAAAERGLVGAGPV